MLRPDKHTNIQLSIVYLAGIVMKIIQENEIIKYDDLRNSVIQMVGNKSNENFEFALSFLFLLDKIDYLKELDSLKQN